MSEGDSQEGLLARIAELQARITEMAKPVPASSPLAPEAGFPEMPVVDGVRFAAASAGVRYPGRVDVMLAELAPGSTVAGVFTRSTTRAAPVLDCQAKLGREAEGGAAIIVNSGNANAFTGADGERAVAEVTAAVAKRLGLDADRVFSSSTGVIGEKLPRDRIVAVLDDLARDLDGTGIAAAARAIMTTDTFPKGCSRRVELDGRTVSIAGIAKGSGMIAPDMATMLAYVFTDAEIPQDVLQQMLSAQCDRSFNCITVDSDTSTSDCVLLAATGRGPRVAERDSPAGRAFEDALGEVMLGLAHQIVRDGEGATKFIEVAVTSAVDDGDARRVALSIANSPLVKTAAAGEDPNWGRIVMAVGKSGAAADRDLLSIRFGDILVAEKGWVADSYSEEAGAEYMTRNHLILNVDLGLGDGKARIWTCDLTQRYIEINADYRS